MPETKVIPLNANNPQFNTPGAQNYPLIVSKDDVYSYLKTMMTECKVFRNDELEFIEAVASRLDGQPGLDQVSMFVQTCEGYLKANKEGHLTTWDKLKHQEALRKALEFVMGTAYRQKRILIGISMRVQHPKYNVYNLNNLISSQKLRVDICPTYGLGYTQARTHIVKTALSNAAYSHVLFIDDDILCGVDVVERLSDYNLPVVAGIYLKKNETFESISSTVVPGGPYLFENIMVKPEPAPCDPIQVFCVGLGLTMISTDIFKHKIPNENDWFQFVHEMNPDGSRGRVLVGEDARAVQLMQANGIRTWLARDVIGVHVDYKQNGKMYGPDWLVDSERNVIREQFRSKYTCLPSDLNVKDLVKPDNDNVFSSTSL